MSAGFARWAIALLPALALSACGGTRLSHEEILAALNAGGGAASVPAGGGQASVSTGGSATPGVMARGGSPLGGASAGGVSAGGTTVGGTATTGMTGNRTARGAGTPAHSTLAPASAPSLPGASGAPILLGNVGNYSGPAGSSTSAAPTALRVWAQWVNAHAGIAGHPVEVFTADDGADPARSRSLIQDMVENRHVIAFVGNMTIQTSDAGVSYLEQKHVPVIGGDLTTSQWTSSPVFFPMGTSWLPLIESTLKSAHDAGATRVAVLYCVESSACDVTNRHVNDTAARYGEQVVYTSRVTVTQPDYTAQCLGAQQNGAQAIWLGVDAGSQQRIANSCARQNYHPLYLVPNVASTTEEAQTPALDGTIAPAPVFPWMVSGGNPEIDAYHQAMQEYAPGVEGSGSTAIQWVSGELFRKAAANVGDMPTSDAILNGLWGLKNETLGGLTPPLTYAAHQPSPQVTCYYITKISGGRWTAPYGAKYQCL